MTEYVGLFGALCKFVPIFDARAPDGWTVMHRSWHWTRWEQTRTGAIVDCRKEDRGWNVYIRTHAKPEGFRVLPKNATRWAAFGAVRSFFDGEPLMKAEFDGTEDGLVRSVE